jgi:cytochrome c553
MSRVKRFAAILMVLSVAAVSMAAGALTVASAEAERRTTSLLAFSQMERVFASPRCQNCHTTTGFPRQGDDGHPHRLNVLRGTDDHGAAALRCATCHGRANNAYSGVPGADDDWHLAPLVMGWEGLTPSLLCEHLKDRHRNGGRDGAAVIDHLKTHLVAWAWTPGIDAHGHPRSLPPMAYGDFLEASATWVRTGAECPAKGK